jgi:mono/diheme cytochrome c family protein
MTGPSTAHDAAHTSSDGLWRWLLGGLAGGGVILGLLLAAYAIGYHRGRHRPPAAPAAAAPAPTTTATTTAAATTSGSTTIGPVQATPALVARGKALYTSAGCSSCHSLSGSSGAGPTFKGLAGSTVTLDNGQTVAADGAYLDRSIVDPDAEIVKGYRAGIMSAAIAGRDFAAKPDEVQALVAFLESLK